MTKQKPTIQYTSPGDDHIVAPTSKAMMNLLHDRGRPPTFEAAVYATCRLTAAMFVTFVVNLDRELEDDPESGTKMAGELRAIAQFLDPKTRDEASASLSRFNGERLKELIEKSQARPQP